MTEVLLGRQEEGAEQKAGDKELDVEVLDNIKAHWSLTLTGMMNTQRYRCLHFLEPNPGRTPRFPNIDTTRERKFFDILFMDSIWELLVRETNKHYNQNIGAGCYKLARRWQTYSG